MTKSEDRSNAQEGGAYRAASMNCEATRLMHATKGGDRDAFDQLVQQLRGRAFSIAHSLVGTREDALEVAQEAFLKTYRARETFRDGEPFLPWFHRILRNTCFSFLRKSRRIRPVSIHAKEDDDRGDFEIAGDGPAPSEGVEREEVAGLFWEAFRQLSSRDREILDLRHFQDLAYKDIAAAMDCPVGTVMSRLFHARRRLRERLAPFLEPDPAGAHLDVATAPPEGLGAQ